MPNNLATYMKPSISHFRILFSPFVLRKATTHGGTKALNILHHTWGKGFLQYLCWNYKASKSVSSLCTIQTEDCIFVQRRF